MKLYADYIKEREGKECMYNDDMFITYKIYEDDVSIIDIYACPKIRNTKRTFNFVMEFFDKMKDQGIKKAFGFTDETTKGWKESEERMLNFGFKKLDKINENYNNYVLDLKEIQ